MKYFIDTEFHEYKKKPLFGKAIDTIELISIGIVSENNREYYSICKEFDLKSAWSRYDIKTRYDAGGNTFQYKDYWLRENVLKPIFVEECEKIFGLDKTTHHRLPEFSYRNMKLLINRIGKTNKQIAEEVYKFIYPKFNYNKGEKYLGTINKFDNNFVNDYWVKDIYMNPQFYGYYADYDWVVFCWLFGRMIDLPTGFPMFCIDLKQTLDEKAEIKAKEWGTIRDGINCFDMQNHIKTLPNYPKQINEHNALADAKWNKALYEFLETIK